MVDRGFVVIMFNSEALRAVVHTDTKVEEEIAARNFRMLPLPIYSGFG
jgi:hypothetical protein